VHAILSKIRKQALYWPIPLLIPEWCSSSYCCLLYEPPMSVFKSLHRRTRLVSHPYQWRSYGSLMSPRNYRIC